MQRLVLGFLTMAATVITINYAAAAQDGHGGPDGPHAFFMGKKDVSKVEFEKRGADMFKRLDANGDGSISLSEWQAHHAKMFDKADLNKDGTITADERREVHKKMMEHRRQGYSDKK